MEKIKNFILTHKQVSFSVVAFVLVSAVLSVSISVYLSNSRRGVDDVFSDDTFDDFSYDLGVHTMPDEFYELNQFIDPDDNHGIIETGNDFIEDTDNTQESAPPPYYVPAEPIVTGLPAVHITTNSGGGIVSRTNYINGTFSITAPDGSGFQSFDRVSVRARGRGNSTWEAIKKPYRLNFSERVSFLGLPAGRNFVLLANAYDRSHIRNSVAFATARTLSFDFVPTAIHVDLYVNGKYMGLYTIGDSVRVSSDGIGIERDGGFLVELGGVKNDIHVYNTDFFHSNVHRHMRVRYPQPRTSLTATQMSEVRGYFQAACNSVIALTDYEEHFDMLSFIDYFLLTELTYNLDGAFVRSVFLSKNPGKKIKLASVWDFDLAFGNYSADKNRYNVWASVHNEDSHFTRPTWINHLIECEAFQYAVRKRWSQVGDRMFNAAIAEIRRNRAFLNNGVRQNNTVAPFRQNRYTARQTNNINTWAGQLDYLETFLTLRRRWINAQVAAFPTEPPNGRDILYVLPPVTDTPYTETELTNTEISTHEATAVTTETSNTPYETSATPDTSEYNESTIQTETTEPTEPPYTEVEVTDDA
jgi:hypothetical protein